METGKENPYSCVVLAGMRNQEPESLKWFRDVVQNWGANCGSVRTSAGPT